MTVTPSTPVDARDWLYVKIYVGPSAARINETVLRCVEPLVRELLRKRLITRFFFVVYGEGAPHVRLRVAGEREVLDTVVRARIEAALPALFERVSAMPLDEHIWTGRITKEFPAFEYDVYVPEAHVYGGPRAMPWAEAHFQDASELAFRMMEIGTAEKLSAVLSLTEILVEAFSWLPERRADFYAAASDHWLGDLSESDRQVARDYFATRYAALEPRLESILSMRSSPPRTLAPWLAFWSKSVQRTSDALRALSDEGQLETKARYIVQSFIHMLHNRLGVPVNQETFNLYMLGRHYAREAVIAR